MPDKFILPEHIGIIMDGNGRWAKKRGLPRNAGHKKGAEVFEEISRCCRDLGIKWLTVYAFSTENWKRPKEEVDGIMNLMRGYLKTMAKTLCMAGFTDTTEKFGTSFPYPNKK